jgi:sugar phosphate isomerase/epimerase
MITTRRRFLASTTLALSAVTLPRSLRGATAKSDFNLGMSLYGMKTLPLTEAVATCARIGYRNIELCLDPGFHAEPAKFSREARQALRRQVEGLGLTISGLMLNLNLADPAAHGKNEAAIKTAAELAQDVSPGAPPPLETVSRGRPTEWEALKDGMADRLRHWGGVAAAGRVKIVLKAHFNGAVSTPDQLAWIVQQVNQPSIRAAYDFSHFELRDIPMAKSWETLARYTDFVHVKDTAGNAQKAQMLLPGEGRTDYVALFRLMRATGYRGPVVVEVSTQIFSKPGYDPIAAAEKSYAALSRAMAAVK